MQLNGNNLVFNINNNTGTNVGTFSVSSIIDDNWHHFVWNIAQNGKWTFYIDNVYTNPSVTATLPIETNTANTRYLGRSIEATPKYLTGIIDDFRIYNRTLTATEVDLIYNTTNATADLANMTGILAISKGGTGKATLLPSRFLTTDANSTVDDSITIPLPLNKGGIGVTSLTNGIMHVNNSSISTITSLPVSSGGIGTTSLGSANGLVWYENATTKLNSFTLSANQIICTNSSSALTSLGALDVSRGGTGAGTTNRGILFANGADAFTSLGSNLPIKNGGTGVNTLPVGILLGDGTNPLSSVSTLNVGRGGIGTTTIVGFLYGNGANAVTGIGTTNILPLANGGTGRSDGIDAANIKNQDGLYTSANRKGPSKLYRDDADTNNWIGVKADNNRWLIYSSDNIDTRVKYADTAGSASSCSGNAATATTASSCSGNAATATTAGGLNGTGYSGPLVIDPNYTTNNYVLIWDQLDVRGNVYVSGSISEGGSWLSDKYHPKNGSVSYASSAGNAANGNIFFYRSATNYWYIGCPDSAESDNNGTNFHFNCWRDSTWQTPGFVEDDLSGSWKMNFTGQHRTVTNDKTLHNNKYIGYIVSSIGIYKEINSKYHQNNIKQNININDALPFVILTNVSYDKRIFGIITDSKEDENRRYSSGAFVSVYAKDIGDERLIVNGCGEGSIWVSDYNGILENGDYITTSAIPGIGMKQDDDLLHNYTVAKITMDCDFDPQYIPIEVIKQQKYNTTITSNITNTIKYFDKLSSNMLSSNITSTIYIPSLATSNMLDEEGNLIYEYQRDANSNIVYDYEYDMKYIKLDGTIVDKIYYEANKYHTYRMAFVGCTYKCS
jgi:hypothetical protein